MAADINNNGIDDGQEIAIHWKSAIIGSLLALGLGGSIIGLGKALAPESETMRAIGKWFAGSACDEVEDELNAYKDAWSCIEGGAAITGTDISVCASKLEEKE